MPLDPHAVLTHTIAWLAPILIKTLRGTIPPADLNAYRESTIETAQVLREIVESLSPTDRVLANEALELIDALRASWDRCMP